MAFTVGWPTASSPVSVEYADGYFADRGIPDWTGDDTVKQGALVRATDYVNAMFSARFDPDLFVDPLTGLPVVPDVLLKAVCEYALIELKLPSSLAPTPAVDASGFSVVMTKKKVGPIEKDFAVVPGSKAMSRRPYPIADALIATLLLPPSRFNRVIR